MALKILAPERVSDPAFAERLAREARTLARLSHPHIVGVYDVGETGDLLVSSPTPGHAMRALEVVPGSIVGKALEPLDFGTGVIRVLLMPR